MTLHILTRARSQSDALDQVLKLLRKDDMILLCCDATYDFGIATTEPNVVALDSDMAMRGLVSEQIKRISMDDFVALTEKHATIQSWR